MEMQQSLVRWALLCLAAIIPGAGVARGQGTITANPGAEVFHGPWRDDGYSDPRAMPAEYRFLGAPGSLGDINNDGLDDFGIHVFPDGAWELHLGDTTNHFHGLRIACGFPGYGNGPIAPDHPVVGDFWGTGRRAVAFGGYQGQDPLSRYQLAIYRTDSGALAPCPTLLLDPVRTMTPSTDLTLTTIVTGDLDGNGADELVVVSSSVRRNGIDDGPEIWIYRGGPDFQVDRPSLIIRTPCTAAGMADLDGDHRLCDMSGKMMAAGRVESWRGEALWNCAGTPAGVYLLSIFDRDGALIATRRIVRE
ncbi:MAG: hypothetical protein JWQ98_3244 [Chlorobi bacterium]|nr:hypothetical protein [Chlorobiota bacterium]